MRTMIQNVMSNLYACFTAEINGTRLCELKTLRYDQCSNPDYSKPPIQHLYLLRYFPAYLCEYRYLYEKVVSDARWNQLSVLSVGCGCCVDYYGAYFAVQGNTMRLTYLGIDPIKWCGVDSLGNANFRVICGNAGSVVLPAQLGVNVMFFPKSLSEFGDSDFSRFLEMLGGINLTSPHICLVSSIMDKGFGYDQARYKRIADVLVDKGYVCDNYSPAQEMKEKAGLRKLYGNFVYPDEVKTAIANLSACCVSRQQNGRCCKEDCATSLDKQPILTSTYMSFQLNRFARPS